MAHPDLDALLSPLFSMAQDFLGKNGEFLPFGATMDPSGKVSLAAVDSGKEGEEIDHEELVSLLTTNFQNQARAGKIRAAGVCVDIRVVPPGETKQTDALCALLEHQSGESIQVFLPYRKALLGGLKYGEVFVGTGERQIFEASDAS